MRHWNDPQFRQIHDHKAKVLTNAEKRHFRKTRKGKQREKREKQGETQKDKEKEETKNRIVSPEKCQPTMKFI